MEKSAFHRFAQDFAGDSPGDVEDTRKAELWRKEAQRTLKNAQQKAPAAKLDRISLLDLATGEDWAELKQSAAKAGGEEVKDVNEIDDFDGTTALHWTAKAGRKLCVEALLAARASPHMTTSQQQTPLYWAADAGHSEVVECLLAAKAQPDVLDRTGSSPLHRAAAGGHAGCCTLLLTAKATCELRDHRGWTALHKAAFEGQEEAVRALLLGKADPTASSTSNLTAVQLVKEQADSNPHDRKFQKTHALLLPTSSQ